MLFRFLGLLLFWASTLPAQPPNPVYFSGKIGKYPIALQINSVGWHTGRVVGYYRYLKNKNYLRLGGHLRGQTLELLEYAGRQHTGTFYLKRMGNVLKGRWVSVSGSYDVILRYRAGNLGKLVRKRLVHFSVRTNRRITGAYGYQDYFLNDYHYTKERPHVEIGFNGGYALIEKLAPNRIKFQAQVVVGPTYHLAYAAGVAYKKKNVFVFEEGACVITIRFKFRRVIMKANNSLQCGFGARSHLDHEFIKIRNDVSFVEETSLKQLLKN